MTLEIGENGYVVTECPVLPGCASQGRTREEALAHIHEAIELSIETRRAHGLPLQLEVAEVAVCETVIVE